MYELGLIDDFLKLPHRKVMRFSMQIGAEQIRVVDLSHLPTHCKYIALMPQWDFLDFIAQQGGRYPTFGLHMRTEAIDLIEQAGRVVGVRAKTAEGDVTVRADLVVGCDGRHSTVRAKAGLQGDHYGAPMDVLWFRITRKDSDTAETLGHIAAGTMLVMLDRGDYWQCAYVIPKGGIDRVTAEGIDAFRRRVIALSPFLADRIGELESFDQVKLLSVSVDLLRKWWRPGLICIGDAAHAMSPIGGVGINIAVQDAVAAANRLAVPLKSGRTTTGDLEAIERRRRLPAQLTQRVQLMMQRRMISRALEATQTPKPPLLFKLFDALPVLQRIPGRLLAMGFRPEHVQTPDVSGQR